MSIDSTETIPPQPPPSAPPPGATAGTIGVQDRQLAVLTHLSALTGYLVPLANLIIPLVIWLIKKDESPDIDAVGREVINFNLSVLLYAIGSAILCVILIGFVMLAALYVFGIVVTIIAAVRANDGWRYRYPLTIRFL